MIAGITYIYFKRIGDRKNQDDIGSHFNCSSVCIRQLYHKLMKDDFVKEWWETMVC